MFHASDSYSIAIFTCEDNIYRACCSIPCMSLSFVPIRVSRDIQLFQTVKDVKALNPLVDLLESIEFLLKYLYICTEIPPTTAITLIVVKTLVELLHPRTGNQSNPSQWRATRCVLLRRVLPDSMHPRAIFNEALWWEIRSTVAGALHIKRPSYASRSLLRRYFYQLQVV